MRSCVLKLLITGLIVYFLYQKIFFFRLIASGLFVIACFFCPRARTIINRGHDREKIFLFLGNKILISSVLIVLADLKVVHVAIIAWVIGIEFLLSGVDLLKRSLYQESSQSLFFYKKSFLEIFLLFFLLMIFAFQSSLSVFFYQFVQMGISLVWVFLAAFFMISSLVSKRFQALLKEA